MQRLLSILAQVLEREIFPLVKGFKDTPFIVYMLKTQSWRGQKYIDRVYFEQEVGLNRHWLQVRPYADSLKPPTTCKLAAPDGHVVRPVHPWTTPVLVFCRIRCRWTGLARKSRF